MKNVLFATVAIFAFSGVSQADTLCADKGRWGWKIYGPDFNSNYTDWATNKAIGEAIGDGNCQEGWQMVSDADPRIVYGGSTQLVGSTVDRDRTLTGSSSSVSTADAGRITATYQGFAPEVLKGRSLQNGGDASKWKLVSSDGNGGGTYRLTKKGSHPWSVGTTHHFTSQMIIDRDYRNGTATVNPKHYDNLRYAASQDTTTTTNTYEVEETQVHTYNRTRTFCPTVWTYTFVNPNGEAVASYEGPAGDCTEKTYQTSKTVTKTYEVTGSSTHVGEKYVTPES